MCVCVGWRRNKLAMFSTFVGLHVRLLEGGDPVVGLLCAGRLSQVHAMPCAHVWGMPTRA